MMSRNVVFSILFTMAILFLAAYGGGRLVFRSQEHMAAEIIGEDHQRGGTQGQDAKAEQHQTEMLSAEDRSAISANPPAKAQGDQAPRIEQLSLAEGQEQVEDVQDHEMLYEVHEFGSEGGGLEPEDLHGRALGLQKGAVAHLNHAAELSLQGNVHAARQHEMMGLELESKANELIAQTAAGLEEARAREIHSVDAFEGFESQQSTRDNEQTPPGFEDSRQEAEILLEQAQAYAASAIQLREGGNELQAIEYEEMALEFESAANYIIYIGEQILHDYRTEELKAHEMEWEDQPS